MIRAVLLTGILTLTCGCSSAYQASYLSPEDVRETIQLRDNRNVMTCGKYMIAGDLSMISAGANGSATGIIMSGKGVTFQECKEYLDKHPQP